MQELVANFFPPVGGPALVPLNDPMVLVNGQPSLPKVNLYRDGAGQPHADQQNASAMTYWYVGNTHSRTRLINRDLQPTNHSRRHFHQPEPAAVYECWFAGCEHGEQLVHFPRDEVFCVFWACSWYVLAQCTFSACH